MRALSAFDGLGLGLLGLTPGALGFAPGLFGVVGGDLGRRSTYGLEYPRTPNIANAKLKEGFIAVSTVMSQLYE